MHNIENGQIYFKNRVVCCYHIETSKLICRDLLYDGNTPHNFKSMLGNFSTTLCMMKAEDNVYITENAVNCLAQLIIWRVSSRVECLLDLHEMLTKPSELQPADVYLFNIIWIWTSKYRLRSHYWDFFSPNSLDLHWKYSSTMCFQVGSFFHSENMKNCWLYHNCFIAIIEV